MLRLKENCRTELALRRRRRTFMHGRLQSGAKQRGAEQGRRGRKNGADDESKLVAAVERGERAGSGRDKVIRAGGGKAGEDGQPKRAAHHERGVDDSRGKAGFARL